MPFIYGLWEGFAFWNVSVWRNVNNIFGLWSYDVTVMFSNWFSEIKKVAPQRLPHDRTFDFVIASQNNTRKNSGLGSLRQIESISQEQRKQS